MSAFTFTSRSPPEEVRAGTWKQALKPQRRAASWLPSHGLLSLFYFFIQNRCSAVTLLTEEKALPHQASIVSKKMLYRRPAHGPVRGQTCLQAAQGAFFQQRFLLLK